MAGRTFIGLDDPAFHGRLRRIHAKESLIPTTVHAQHRPSANYFKNNLSEFRQQQSHSVPDVTPVDNNLPTLNQASAGVMVLELPEYIPKKATNWSQMLLITLAAIFFLVGLFVSGLTLKSNAEVKARLQSQQQTR